MDLNWLESLIYGVVSGLAEFLPISSRAHQYLLLNIFGSDRVDPLRNFLIDIALLLALYSACRSLFAHIRRDLRIQSQIRRGRTRITRSLLDLKMIRNATLPMLIGMLILSYILNSPSSMVTVAVLLLINGIILFVPERMMRGNKDVRSMSLFDSVFLGLAGSLSAFIGISRVGITITAATARGADRHHALNWALLLSVPALVLISAMDFINIFSVDGIVFWVNILPYLISAIGAYAGGYFSIKLMKMLAANMGISGFAYYSWGASLLTFLLYLTVA